MEQTPLSAQTRTVLGRDVKKLRKDGIIPAHVFGNKIETSHIQVNGKDFHTVFAKVGETGIIALTVEGHKKPVLIKNTQIHPVTDELLHVDFYQVNLQEKVKVNVPIEFIGESPAVEKKIGLLLTPIAEIEVEALPGDLPESIEVDISALANIDDEIKVKDLKVDRSKIELLADEEQIVVQIGELVTKEMEAIEAEAEAEAAAAEPTEAVETVEGAEAVEGESAEGAEALDKPKEEKSE